MVMSKAWRENVPVGAWTVKLKNRRVSGALMRDGSIRWKFKMLHADQSVTTQTIRLSREAVMAMFRVMVAMEDDAKTMLTKGTGVTGEGVSGEG